MKRPLTRFKFGSGFLYSMDYEVIPSLGVGSVLFKTIYGSIWTGEVHINPPNNSPDGQSEVNLDVSIGSITEVATRLNLDEDEVEWNVVFSRQDVPFSYEYERKLESLIKNISTLD